jgi:hypothetical protein
MDVTPEVQEKLDTLKSQGFDSSYFDELSNPDGSDSGELGVFVKCSGCSVMCINGTACHETGCHNAA